MTPSPFHDITLATFARRLRAGELSAEATTRTLLTRIDTANPKLRAFTFIAAERALAQAAAVDRLLAAGVDLGPLMGVPIAVKDLFSVDGMPTTAGSEVDISDLVRPQGRFIDRLQRAGCVILGKTATTEFALGGFNLNTPPPWNPCDPQVARMTGGSSHGSAVAIAAELAGFALGSDTGGSVRWPAAMCGVAGYKATTNHWPQDGVFPLSRDMDSLGVFASCVEDLVFVHAALAEAPMATPIEASRLVLALPGDHFFQNIEPEVRACFERAESLLRAAGATIREVALPEAAEIDAVFGSLVSAEWLAFVGRERFLANESRIDPVVAARVRGGLDLRADEYVRLASRHHALVKRMAERAEGIDGWISPTVVKLPAPCSDFRTVDDVAAWNRATTQNTRPANLFGQCGVSLPMQHLGAPWPAGFQLCAAADDDRRMLAVALTIEGVIGRPSTTLDPAFADAPLASAPPSSPSRHRAGR
ncbi:MAG: amidase [Pseudomonadota bacterium]|nr:amidase [Pseudomonadota bacterium]